MRQRKLPVLAADAAGAGATIVSENFCFQKAFW
jgi:hypothetical protein